MNPHSTESNGETRNFVTFVDNNDPPTSSNTSRLVVVRYYLDRPGYDIHHSSARLWKDPPPKCSARDVATFLTQQGLLPMKSSSTTEEQEEELLVEIYLDKFKSYMLLKACEAGNVCFDFSDTSPKEPGILNIRFTDIVAGQTFAASKEESQLQVAAAAIPKNCNTSQIGLFAFSLTVGLETTELTGRLVGGGRIDDSFVLTWGPYAFFVSGLLQLIVGQWEVTRNNVYGATAFMAFGSFWLANGLKLILVNYFPDEIPEELLEGSDPWGNCIRNVYILAFACVLFYQTLAINKFTTITVVLLIVMLFGTAFAGWSTGMEYLQMISGWILSAWAFFVFMAEFTNEVYNHQVFELYPWHAGSSNEVFGTAGRRNTLTARAYKLRSASLIEAFTGGSSSPSTSPSEGPLLNQSSELNQSSDDKPKNYTLHGLRSVTPEDKSK